MQTESLKHGSMVEKKAATTGSSADVISPVVAVPTYAEDVVAPSLFSSAESANPAQPTSLPPSAIKPVSSPLNYTAWEEGLRSHPDREYVNNLLHDIIYGVSIGYSGPRSCRISKNWPSSVTFKTEIMNSINDDISMGRIVGPVASPMFDNFVGSPLGAFQKVRSNKIRIIHDLSWPPGQSINEHISKEDYTMEFIKFDDITHNLQVCNKPIFMSKLDVRDAYKYIIVREQDWELLGFTFPDAAGKLQYYTWKCLPFGLRSAPCLFEQFACGMEYIMRVNGATNIMHYMDDYFTYETGYKKCENNLKIMLETCKNLGMEVQPTKVVSACTRIEILGIIIDTDKQLLQISAERLADITEDLKVWNYKKNCTKRELLSIIGKLAFIAKVVRSGRTFTRRLIELSKKVQYLHHRIRLNAEARADFQWWLSYLPHYNGITYFYDENWTSNTDLELWTDASDTGYGIYYARQWIYEPFSGELEYLTAQPIAVREMYAIVIAAATFGKHFRSYRILFHCDNQNVVSLINSGVSKNVELMKLIRKLFYIAAFYNFECSAKYITSKNNYVADAISRGRIKQFKYFIPDACDHMTLPAKI